MNNLKDIFQWSDYKLDFSGGTLVMGILNITPDSFSDGGLFLDPAKAIEQALRMAEKGAAIIDIGAESTRPGSMPVSAAEQIDRVLPVIEALRKQTIIPLSVPIFRQTVK